MCWMSARVGMSWEKSVRMLESAKYGSGDVLHSKSLLGDRHTGKRVVKLTALEVPQIRGRRAEQVVVKS